jgi:hypothetical protein
MPRLALVGTSRSEGRSRPPRVRSATASSNRPASRCATPRCAMAQHSSRHERKHLKIATSTALGYSQPYSTSAGRRHRNLAAVTLRHRIHNREPTDPRSIGRLRRRQPRSNRFRRTFSKRADPRRGAARPRRRPPSRSRGPGCSGTPPRGAGRGRRRRSQARPSTAGSAGLHRHPPEADERHYP